MSKASKKKEAELAAYRAKPPITKEVADLCYIVYLDEIDRDDNYTIRNGLSPRERLFAKYEKKYGSKDKAEAAIRDNSLIHRIHVEATLKVLKDWEKNPPKFLKAKKSAGKNKDAEFDPTFIFELCVQYHSNELDRWNPPSKDGTKSHERAIAQKIALKKGDKEAGLKRYREYAQIHAPEVRAVLRALDSKGKLPKGARP